MFLITSSSFPILRWELSGLRTVLFFLFAEDIFTKGYFQVGFLLQLCFHGFQPVILPVETGGSRKYFRFEK